jgi:hypothetical protein
VAGRRRDIDSRGKWDKERKQVTSRRKKGLNSIKCKN